MPRASRLLAIAGSILIVSGLLLLLGTSVAPEAAPGVTITIHLGHFLTPTPAYLGTPLPPPSGQLAGEVAIMLPVMPVGGTDTPTRTLSPTTTHTLLPTMTSTPTRTPSATPTPAPSPTATRRPAVEADGSQTRPYTATFMMTATVTDTLTPTPTPTPTDTPTATFPPTATPTVAFMPAGTPTPAKTPTPPPLVPRRILIPALDVDAPVQPVGWHTLELDGVVYGQWDVPEGYAAGWHNTSAPLGQPGNTVLNGHHNAEGHVFDGLIHLVPGDEIILESEGRQFRYVVAQMMVLQERWRTPDERLENARWILPGDDERVTLVTCWPENDNSHRLIVVAVPEAE